MMKLIGHRGARGLAPENTIASLQKALDSGVDEIEIDVRVTADAVPVLSHDKTLISSDGRKVIVANYTYDGLKNLKPDLTTLKEAIAFIKRRVPLQIEVKPAEPVEPVISVIKQCLEKDWRESDFLLASKSQSTLRSLHDRLPKLRTVVIESWSAVRATWRCRQLATKRLSMNQRFLWVGVIRSLARGGYQLTPYTVNDVKRARRWAQYGIYGVITDYPNKYKESKK
jgi:glycerophosphoryl diester phosphodiesterase